MINLKNTQQSYGLNEQKKAPAKKARVNSENCNTKESTIKAVLDCISRGGKMSKKMIVKRSGVSCNSVKRSLLILAGRNKVSFDVVGYAGPHEKRIYSAVKE